MAEASSTIAPVLEAEGVDPELPMIVSDSVAQSSGRVLRNREVPTVDTTEQQDSDLSSDDLDEDTDDVQSAEKSRLPCPECDRTFANLKSLRGHQKIHENKKEYKCDLCPAAFNQRPSLMQHRVIHFDKKPFVCERCKQGFRWHHALKAHMRVHLEVPLVRFTCDQCGKGFFEPRSLAKHQRAVHQELRPYSCTHCDMKFKSTCARTLHIRMHTGEKPYKCRFCDKSFTSGSQRLVHTRTHTGEKPFKCDECGKEFGHSSTLKTHKRSHIGETFDCPCGSSFTRPSSRQKHQRSHCKLLQAAAQDAGSNGEPKNPVDREPCQ